MLGSRPNVLLISAEPVGHEMRGNSIRAYELSKVLAHGAEVTLAGVDAGVQPGLDVPTITYDRAYPSALLPTLERADVVVAQPPWPLLAHWLRRSGARLIFDLYDPEPFEVLEFLRERSPHLRRLAVQLTLDRISAAMHSGHHFLCASTKQQDLWVGALLAERLIGPTAYDRDPGLLSVIDIVPFGVDEMPPARTGPGPRELIRGLHDDDDLVLWNGGIWGWLDAPTAIRAIGVLAKRRPKAKLVFMGASAQGPGRGATEAARALARDLGLLDRSVFFNDAWVPYRDRGNWLLEADCALSTHANHLETRFAYRTRLLDCFWAGLPVVCTAGDDLAGQVQRDGLGEAVPQQDPAAVAAGLERVLERGRQAFAPALARAAEDASWRRVAEPLVRFASSRGTPQRLNEHAHTRLGQRLRDLGFRSSFAALGAVGIRRWPGL